MKTFFSKIRVVSGKIPFFRSESRHNKEQSELIMLKSIGKIVNGSLNEPFFITNEDQSSITTNSKVYSSN